MIGALSGNVIERLGDTIILDVHGVGYELTVSAAVLSKLASLPQALRLTVFTDVRENAISLFGFSSPLEREVFLLLKKVKGIGSKTAMAILSALGPQALLVAIGRSDITALKRVSGVGGKTAERIIVELREQVNELVVHVPQGPLSQSIEIEHLRANDGIPASAKQDVISALEKLGFSLDHAQAAVSATISKHEHSHPEITNDAGELLRLALGNL